MKSLFILSLLNSLTNSQTKTICQLDERQISYNEKVARTRASLLSSSPCSASLIGKNCLISAGHCQDGLQDWITEFDTPLSDMLSGKMNPSLPENIFNLKKVYGRKNAFHGKDWLVFSVKRNEITGNFPGEERGHYEILKTLPLPKSLLRITGYGLSSDKEKRNTQQSSTGELLSIHSKRNIIHHKVDTTAGNSGSSIIDVNSGKILGVHTHGGCRQHGGQIIQGNQGTVIFGNSEFEMAIKNCLENED
ncbi:serine protease [Bacteriovorax sp. DB6_IX]|uniref:trypsin-like serine peptidase n=1 Tax=Bacteriovorax sp. DB6_IX TaxID=1353530 RepID=UPI00038A4087|nr:trypsin-like serine protease [Bacteriovorax sp. DB6_IX]EQC49853.1 trypsin [Bacteriovorax sp. DB6_IX]